ncbi:MAG: PIN domain-containing protein [Nakamurella sp.]
MTEAPSPPGSARTLAELRATSGLKLPDCIVLHTALEQRAVLASFDNRLRRTAALHGVQVHG